MAEKNISSSTTIFIVKWLLTLLCQLPAERRGQILVCKQPEKTYDLIYKNSVFVVLP